MSTFQFASAAKILFGPGCIEKALALAEDFGQKVMVVTPANQKRARPVLDLLKKGSHRVALLSVAGEPTLEQARSGAEQAKQAGCEWVLGVGGGSALDLAKAIAALAANPGEPLDYLEVIGKGLPLEMDPLPFVAIPTTAGTGSEVTKNAVLKSEEKKVKVSMRHDKMLARIAAVDPTLTHSLPPALTASSGLDGLTQLIEPFLSCRANPLTDALCREALPRVARSLEPAWADGADAAAREDMALASLFGGLALANAGLGAVHGFAGPLGGMFPAPHGMVCARLLPEVLEANWQALQEEAPDSTALARLEELGTLLTGRAGAQEGVNWTRDICHRLEIPPLSSWGLEEGHFPEVVKKAQAAGSMKGNPLPLSDTVLRDILKNAL